MHKPNALLKFGEALRVKLKNRKKATVTIAVNFFRFLRAREPTVSTFKKSSIQKL
jgi:hypothetical protein